MRPYLCLLLIFGARVYGCSCGANGDTAKQAWQKAPFVFLGTVELATPDGTPRQMIFQNQAVRLRVDEAFKGVTSGQRIELTEYGNDCSAKFRTGQRLVFYLYPGDTPGSMAVPWCTYALGSAAPGGEDLLFLHGLPKSAKGTRLSGEVDLYEDSAKQAFRLVGGIPNLPVTISRLGAAAIEAKTNADGVYEVYNLPPGKYTVSIAVPKGLRTTSSEENTTVELTKDGGVSAYFILKADTRVSGRMLDSNGDPIKDVCIDLEPVEGRGEDGARFFDCSKVGGTFQMEMMPAGKYWLVAEDEIKVNGRKSKSTLYYPGVRSREDATVISIEAAKYVDHLDITLPAKERRYELKGRMVFQDGAPVDGAGVTFVSPEHGYSEKADTASGGSFDLLVVAGISGELQGTFVALGRTLEMCPQLKLGPRIRGALHYIDATPVFISGDADRKDLRLVLDSPSCKF